MNLEAISDDQLLETVVLELGQLTESGAGMPFVFNPIEAFTLLGLLQLALRHPVLAKSGVPSEFADSPRARYRDAPLPNAGPRRGGAPGMEA